MKLDPEMVSISSLCQNYLDNSQVCVLIKKLLNMLCLLLQLQALLSIMKNIVVVITIT